MSVYEKNLESIAKKANESLDDLDRVDFSVPIGVQILSALLLSIPVLVLWGIVFLIGDSQVLYWAIGGIFGFGFGSVTAMSILLDNIKLKELTQTQIVKFSVRLFFGKIAKTTQQIVWYVPMIISVTVIGYPWMTGAIIALVVCDSFFDNLIRKHAQHSLQFIK